MAKNIWWSVIWRKKKVCHNMAVCIDDYWQYIIYGVLGVFCIVSEALGLTKKIKPNSVSEACYSGMKSLLLKKVEGDLIPSPVVNV